MHLIKFALLLLSIALGLPLHAQQPHFQHYPSGHPLPPTSYDYASNTRIDPPAQNAQHDYTSNQNSIAPTLTAPYTVNSDTTSLNGSALHNQNNKNSGTPSTERRWFFLHAGIGYFATGADWSQRYPTHLSVPLSVEYSHRSNWSFGVDYSFFLGSNVNDQNLYGDMVNDSGLLLDMNGFPAVIRTYQRGFSTRAFVLKNWILHKHRNSRVLLQTGGGIGYYQHYTKFTFDLDQVPQIDGNYQGGYNRHTQGTLLFEQIKIQYINNDAISFSIGVEAGQGNGRRLHPYDFALQKMQTQRIRDTYIGGVLSIMIPINFRDRISEIDYYME